MKKLLFVTAAVLGLTGTAWAGASMIDTVGTIQGVWKVDHDPVGVPETDLSADGENLLSISWAPPKSRASPRRYLLTFIVPSRYFDCSAKKVTLFFSDGLSLPLEGDGVCRPIGTRGDSGLFFTFPKEENNGQCVDFFHKIASEIAAGAYPASIVYGQQKVDIVGVNAQQAFAEYERDVDPAMNPDFYDKMGIR